MPIVRYSLGHGLLCVAHLYELHLRKWWHYCCITAVFVGSVTRGENIACLLLQLLCQPGERLCCVRLCYGCCYVFCISQERISVSAVPTVPHIFCQPPSSCLAHHGFSKQCAQGNTVRQSASQTGSAIHVVYYFQFSWRSQ